VSKVTTNAVETDGAVRLAGAIKKLILFEQNRGGGGLGPVVWEEIENEQTRQYISQK
jgi:hypothetical protein